MMRNTTLTLALAATIVTLTGAAEAAVVGPYVGPDSGTLHLWQFDEVDNTSSTTAATVGGVALNKGSGATLGSTSFSGFGNAGDTSDNAQSEFLSSNTFNVSTITGTGGAFTFEAMINVSSITSGLQQIFSMEANSNPRPFQFRINSSGTLEFINIGGGGGNISAAIPTSGDEAFVANEWFHVAVAYNGSEGDANNTSLYWTRVDDSRTQASLLATGTMTADLAGSARYGVGNDGRTVGATDKNIEGLIDEVRISGVARGANEFIFTVPEPASFMTGLVGMTLIAGRRRR
jgi:hypothetical protein